MSLVSFLKKPVQWFADLFVPKQQAQQIADKVAAAAQPVVDAFLASHKAQITAAIDAEAYQLKAVKERDAVWVRDRFVAVAQQKAQAIGVPNDYVKGLVVSLDALVLPNVYANADAAIDSLATRAKAIVEAL